MKIYCSLLCITAILSGILTADTIVLKTGTTYEGKILSETADSYLVEIHHSKSIKDERRIPKDQVRKIIEAEKDAKDMAIVKALVPTPDRLTTAAYERRIQTAKSFLTRYPQSTHLKEVTTILKTLEKEHTVIAKGGIKLDGQLISPSDIEANAYDIDARILFGKIKHAAKSGHYQRALRRWETLKNNYPHSTAYQSSLAMVPRILFAHQSDLKNSLRTLKAREAKRQSALKSLNEGDRLRTIAALAENKQSYKARIENEKKELKTQWLTIDPYHQGALEYNLKNAEAELKRLSSYDPSKFKPAGPTYRDAWSALAKNNLEDASLLIHHLKSFKLPDRYTAPLVQRLEEKQTAQIKAEQQAAKDLAEQKRLAAKAAAEKAKKETMEKKK
ncbi:MAG: hypothetical protein KJO21_11505 [Verrucomicrobiae bacterium]|nr:hypothetical protein [Verrucomicrobiae bacterium]NNJ42913.1 hypothetical protein [Akkermansiaceae bacterium]